MRQELRSRPKNPTERYLESDYVLGAALADCCAPPPEYSTDISITRWSDGLKKHIPGGRYPTQQVTHLPQGFFTAPHCFPLVVLAGEGQDALEHLPELILVAQRNHHETPAGVDRVVLVAIVHWVAALLGGADVRIVRHLVLLR